MDTKWERRGLTQPPSPIGLLSIHQSRFPSERSTGNPPCSDQTHRHGRWLTFIQEDRRQANRVEKNYNDRPEVLIAH
ncbi:uncharacterized protein BT62DRAFT_933078 [Guyanagaster necrorhizus]|uniref:Uncharacterized protein n=1 Tax=Guyanagaster necrorhizus TaxID=856835 RepID=A0A9P7VSK7_9AGAR|nr:uncharacterized protein BT62DRAFT_933078 [Guyanagaster necrorhizus MCA 3950]KAG7445259.1 hypothetical protein BT62DRAFT_933078 [Guyanagaster necrorhizus MCA 3950]